MNNNSFIDDYDHILYSLKPITDDITDNLCKKVRSYYNNDIKHLSNTLKKRRKKNKNKKTHRNK